jgi:hypothetical protein
MWKIAKIIPTIKPRKENSMDPSKYRPICLLNIGGKVLEKLFINRINHHMYKNNLMTDRQFGFTQQKSTTDAAMEAKKFIEPALENRGVVIMTGLDVKGAFDAAFWPSIIAVMTTNNVSIKRRVTKGCPQSSCSRSGFWNVLYNSLLNLDLTSHSKTIAFADDLMILTREDNSRRG